MTLHKLPLYSNIHIILLVVKLTLLNFLKYYAQYFFLAI
jgi:hypothetical protein